MARERTPQAIEALTAALANPRERVAAAAVLLDRGWGRAAQIVVGDEDRPVSIEFRWAPATTTATIDAVADDADTDADAGPVVRWGGE